MLVDSSKKKRANELHALVKGNDECACVLDRVKEWEKMQREKNPKGFSTYGRESEKAKEGE